jgi:hypothetical protein
VYQSVSNKNEIIEYYRERNGIKIEDSKTKMKRMWQKIKCNKKKGDKKENPIKNATKSETSPENQVGPI